MASVGGSTEKSGATPIGPIHRNIEEVALALVDRAREVELNRRIPDDIFEMVRATGVYRIMQPAEFGGHQGNPVDAFDAIFELARSCPSTAWVTAVCVLHQWIMGCFSMAAQEDVWGENDQVLLCGSYAPQGQTARAEGGVRLSGVWEFVSGCDNTNWALLGVMVPPEREDERPVPHFALVPKADYRIEDMWHAAGLAGSGSNNVHLDDVFVPEHRLASLLAMTEGTSPGSKHPLYGVPLLSLTPYAISTVGLGAAQGGYDAYVDQVMVRKARGGVLEGGKSLAGIPAVQSRVGEAAGYIDAGRLIIKTDLEENLAIVTSGRKISVSRRIFCKRNEALATRMAVTAANAVYEGAGGAGLLAENRVQRAWRDANAVARHGGLNWDVQMSLYGSHILGLTPRIGY
jgi:alkylation response protein AidB-like acyl-CoA dehydrogenase